MNEEWISLSDFKPGIYGDYHGGVGATSRGSIAANGAAVIDGTYRCCADPAGALVPLPGRSTGRTSTLIPGGNANTGTSYFSRAKGAAYLQDAVAFGYVGDGANDTRHSFKDNAFVFTLWTFDYSTAGSGTYRVMHLGRVFSDLYSFYSTTRDFLWETYANTGAFITFGIGIGSGSLALARAYSGSSGTSVTSALLKTVIASAVSGIFGTRGSAAYAASEAGLTTADTDYSATGANYASGTGANNQTGVVQFAHDPTTHLGIYNYDRGTLPLANPIYCLGHQGRVIIIQRVPNAVGAFGYQAYRDVVSFTGVDDPRQLDPNSTVGTFEIGEENPTGIGAAASLNGSLLFIVKHAGGAYSVQGDIFAPVISRLPYVESTYGVTAQAVTTPIGVVYGSRNGVFVWSGGETSKKLSDQIDGFFWDHAADGEEYEANRGRFGWFHPWVCVPNNYLFDTRTGSWWRLDRPEDAAPDVAVGAFTATGIPYNVYATNSANGKMFAFPYKLTANQNVVYHTYDPSVLASTYSWRSQPLIETRERVRSFQSIRLVASPGSNTAACTVMITLSGFNKDGGAVSPVTTTFTFTGTGNSAPIIQTKDIVANFQAMYVQVRIEVAAASGAAPKIISVQLGTSERARAAKS